MFALIVAREADRHEARARCHERGSGRDLIVVKQAVIDEALAKLRAGSENLDSGISGVSA